MPTDGLAVRTAHDPGLVALSVAISILAAFAARQMVDRVREARGGEWAAWVAGTAAVDGIGTWSMHYTGMLALVLPVPLFFDPADVALSLLVSIAGSGVALLVVGRRGVGWGSAVAAGIVLGAGGISGMHFTAMAALRLPGMHAHHPMSGRVLLAVILACAIASLAAILAFLRPADRPPGAFRRHATAVVRGTANPVMHYTAMGAVIFTVDATATVPPDAVSIASVGLLGLSVVPVMVLVVGLLTSLATRLGTQRALLDELFEQGPQAIALTGVDDRVLRVNREFAREFGYAADEAPGRTLSDLIVPEEARDEARRFRESVARGERVDAETVRRAKDGTRHPVSMIRVPIAGRGGRVETHYAIFTDITERRRAEEALRTYPVALMEAQERERRRMAGELHDEIGQHLTGISLVLSAASRSPPDIARARLDEAQALLGDLISQVRNLALDLRPAMLDEFGLGPALAWLVERVHSQSGIEVDFKQQGLEGRRFAEGVETAAYRIVQEALTNIARHSGARSATVRVWAMPDDIEVEIEDQGAGFDPGQLRAHPHSVGLAGMRERAASLGGQLIVDAAPGSGTRIAARIPFPPGAPGRR
jgi:PAS domain S-box-containing protein